MSRRGRCRWLLCVAALALQPALGEVTIFRCNGWMIENGMVQFEVGQRCGAPAERERRTEWRTQTTFQQQCQTLLEPVVVGRGDAGGGVTYLPRTVCTTIPITITVPVDVDVWYYEDASVPKALHFENGRLFWVEPLWKLRHG